MFDWVCLVIASLLALNSTPEFRAFSFILLAEFIAHKAAFILGIQLTEYLEYSRILLVYMIIQLFALSLLKALNSNVIPKLLIFINLSYNMLTISQYSIKTIDFYGNYKYFVGAIMVLELMLMAGGTRYAASSWNGGKRGNTNTFNNMFFVCRWLYVRLERRIAL